MEMELNLRHSCWCHINVCVYVTVTKVGLGGSTCSEPDLFRVLILFWL